MIDNDMLISLAFDQRIYERLNVGSPKTPTISSLGIMDLCFWPRFSVVLVCGELSVRLDCRKRGHGRMTRQPVEAWPNVVNAQFE
ncbi:unnamed protein product [Penicillium nalgiovense]|nr:unnamed protein product [Penicillium nalgiovense]